MAFIIMVFFAVCMALACTVFVWLTGATVTIEWWRSIGCLFIVFGSLTFVGWLIGLE